MPLFSKCYASIQAFWQALQMMHPWVLLCSSCVRYECGSVNRYYMCLSALQRTPRLKHLISILQILRGKLRHSARTPVFTLSLIVTVDYHMYMLQSPVQCTTWSVHVHMIERKNNSLIIKEHSKRRITAVHDTDSYKRVHLSLKINLGSHSTGG